MKNKILIMVLSMLLFSLCACGKKEEVKPSAEEIIVDPVITPSENTVSDDQVEPAATPTPFVDEVEPVNQVKEGTYHNEIISLVNQREELFTEGAFLTNLELIHDIDKQINELNTYDFSNIKITFLGDSITYGLGGKQNEYGNQVSYADYVGDILGCQVVKMGVPGSAIGNYGSDISFLYRIDDIPEDTDIIVIFGGINDYLCGNAIFGSEEVKDGTYHGAVEELFKKIREKFPDKEIFVILNYKTALENSPDFSDTYPLDQWLDVIRVYAGEYNFHKIEMYRNGFMNSNIPEIRATFFTDEIHPNDAGYIVLARYVAAKIIEAYN